MSTDTVEATCALCGGSERRLCFREGPISVVCCSTCDLTYITPRLGADQLIEQVYDEHYWNSPAASERGYTDYEGDEALYLRTFERRVEGLARHLPEPGRVLDIGCAAGFFLRVMRDRGWDVEGVEPSRPMREVARRALGAGRVHAEPLEQLQLEPESFDLVCLWDVLEHLPDPIAALRVARDLLRPGGRLVVETQNVGSLFARLLGRRWQHYKHAEHLWHFNRATLTSALDQAGLCTTLVTPRHAGKYVSATFVRERVRRVGAWGSLLASPLALVRDGACYLNPYDELIAIAVRD